MVFISSFASSFLPFKSSFALIFYLESSSALTALFFASGAFFLGLSTSSSFFSRLDCFFYSPFLAIVDDFSLPLVFLGLYFLSTTLTSSTLDLLVLWTGTGSSLIFFLPSALSGAALPFFRFFSSRSSFFVFFLMCVVLVYSTVSSIFFCARVFMVLPYCFGNLYYKLDD
jgi:hypothetical protein